MRCLNETSSKNGFCWCRFVRSRSFINHYHNFEPSSRSANWPNGNSARSTLVEHEQYMLTYSTQTHAVPLHELLENCVHFQHTFRMFFFFEHFTIFRILKLWRHHFSRQHILPSVFYKRPMLFYGSCQGERTLFKLILVWIQGQSSYFPFVQFVAHVSWLK